MPSSVGKVTLFLATGLLEEGFSVEVYCAACPRGLHGDYVLYNPRKWCQAGGGGEWCKRLPDTDIVVSGFTHPERFAHMARRRGVDTVLAYATPYVSPGTEFNKAVTSLGKPSVVYAISEVLTLQPGPAMSVVSYSVLSAPTRFVIDTFLRALRLRYDGVGSLPVVVAPHGVPETMYNPGVCPARPARVTKLGFLAKNHMRKDALSFLLTVARLVNEGARVEPLLYMVDAVTEPVWRARDLVEIVESMTGVDLMRRGGVDVLNEHLSKIGLTEEEVTKLYCKMDVLVFPSLGEAFGLPPLEAVLLGRPAIATAHPAIAEIWGETMPMARCRPVFIGTAHLCAPDQDTLYKAVLSTITDPEKTWRREYERAKRYTYRKMVKEIIRAIDTAIRDPDPIKNKLTPIHKEAL